MSDLDVHLTMWFIKIGINPPFLAIDRYDMGMSQNPWYPSEPQITGKWMFIPLKMVLIGIDPYPYGMIMINHGETIDFGAHKNRQSPQRTAEARPCREWEDDSEAVSLSRSAGELGELPEMPWGQRKNHRLRRQFIMSMTYWLIHRDSRILIISNILEVFLKWGYPQIIINHPFL